MITDIVESAVVEAAAPSAAERIARLARSAQSDADAVEAVRRALEELLS
jgi:hypothetical protein